MSFPVVVEFGHQPPASTELFEKFGHQPPASTELCVKLGHQPPAMEVSCPECSAFAEMAADVENPATARAAAARKVAMVLFIRALLIGD